MDKCVPGFSVILPVRNGGAYLHLCVKSILAQTFQNFELVILENQSSDGTAEWLQTLEKQDSRVKVIPSKAPLSMVENWNRILSIPKREFMTIIGHDDLLESDFLSEINILIRNEPNASLYLTHFKLIDRDGGLIRYCNPVPRYETATGFLAARLAEIRDSFGTGYVMKSVLYEKVGGIPPYSNLMYADDALWLKLMSGSFKATSPRASFSYRLHSGSVSGKPNPEALFEGLKDYLNLLSRLASEDEELNGVIKLYAPQYVSKRIQYCYYHDLIQMRRWWKPSNAVRLSELESMLKRFAPATSLDKSLSGLAIRVCRKCAAWLSQKCNS